MQVVPFANYPGRYAGYPGALKTGDKVAPEGCIKQCEGALMLGGIDQRQEDLGKLVGVSRSLVAGWIGGFRHPAPGYQTALEKRLGIPERAWSVWRPSAGLEGAAAPAEEAPISSEHPTMAAAVHEEAPPPAPPPELPADGTPAARARALLTHLSASVMSPAQIAQAREIRHALALEARFLAAAPKQLHEHTNFEAWADGLIAALTRVPGALDALEAFLGPAEEQRAAA